VIRILINSDPAPQTSLIVLD